MYNYNYYPQFNPTPVNQDERIWVQSETSAEAYLVAPNGFVRLWDSSKPVFYEKRADASGRPMPIEAYEYTRVEPHKANQSAESTIDYKDEIESLKARISALEEARKGAKKNVSKSDSDDSRIPEV